MSKHAAKVASFSEAMREYRERVQNYEHARKAFFLHRLVRSSDIDLALSDCAFTDVNVTRKGVPQI